MIARRSSLTLLVLVPLLLICLAAPRLAATAQDGTPTAQTPGSLRAMLALAPDVLAGPNPPEFQIAAYADAAIQLAVLGVDPPPALEEGVSLGPWIGAMMPLYLPDRLVQNAMLGLRELIGFDILQVDQSLITGDTPFQTTFLRGRFSAPEITAALTANGYQQLTVDGHDVLSLAEDETFSVDHPIQQYMLATMNNLVILDDGTVVYASTLEAIRAALAVADGQAPSLAERPEVATVLEQLPEEPASAVLVDGEALRGAPPRGATPNLAATIVAEAERLAPVQFALIGVTPGGPLSANPDPDAPPPPDQPSARFLALLLMEDDAAAEAAPPVIEDRLATGESLAVRAPYTDFFADWSVEPAADAPVVVVEATFTDDTPAAIWLSMFFQRDLAFLAW